MPIPLGDAADVLFFHVYRYEHLDDLAFLRKPEHVFENNSTGRLTHYVQAVEAKLRGAGWEGDGQLEIMWFPPFVDVGVEDTCGTYVWCVKQSNNGTAWLASEVPLNFGRLASQNESLDYSKYLRAGIMTAQCARFRKSVAILTEGLTRRTNALVPNSDPIFQEIRNEMLFSVQSDLVAEFNSFLDDCYLALLIEVIDNGNTSKLQLSKFKAAIEPKLYLPDISFESDEKAIEGNKWLTIKGLIRDIWISYKFEPFPQKTTMLFKACEFPTDSSEMKTIRTHIQLRNCVQHHGRHLTADALKALGLDHIELLTDVGPPVFINGGNAIQFSVRELERLIKAMSDLAVGFDDHSRKRIRRKEWLSPDQLFPTQ